MYISFPVHVCVLYCVNNGISPLGGIKGPLLQILLLKTQTYWREAPFTPLLLARETFGFPMYMDHTEFEESSASAPWTAPGRVTELT